MKTLRISLTLVLIAIWYFLSAYVFMPALAFTASSGIHWNLIFFLLFFTLIWVEWEDGELSPIAFTSLGAAVVIFLIFLVQVIGSTEWLNPNQYHNLIGEVKKTEFTSNVQPISPSQMLIVDEGMAERIGAKELGADPGLGSRATLGKFHLQPVKGHLYWIAPLEHSGFFRWTRFGDEGTPGYVRVSATNEEDHALVTEVNGRKLHIVYQTGAFFSQDLGRHIYTNGYMSSLYTAKTFEVDDNWNPYWSVTLYDTKIGFGGDDAIGSLLINPETGVITEYKLDQVPAWVDRIQPVDFVSEQIDNWGEYIHGYWNLSRQDVMNVADENSLVLGSDGNSYFYFGMTSQGNDSSTVGFMMVSTRTKEAHWIHQSGATETAARGSALGKVQMMNYAGSDAVTYNIDGHATYEYLLKDNAGLMKMIALVNVHEYNIVGVGDNRLEALQDYRSQLSGRGNSTSYSTSDMETETMRSKLARFNSEVTKGNTKYHFILEKNPTLRFTATTTTSEELVYTHEGDPVTIRYVKLNSPGEISVMGFDNLALDFQKDTVQIGNEARLDSTREGNIQNKANEVVDDKINNLSIEEKRELLRLKNKK